MTESDFSIAAGNTHFKSTSPDLASLILETLGARTKLGLWLSSYSWFYLLRTSTRRLRSKTSFCKFDHFLKARIVRWKLFPMSSHLIQSTVGQPFQPNIKPNTLTQNFLPKLSSEKTSQELRMLSRSLSDCKSLILNVMIQVSQFVSNSH